ncbi:MAG: CBS domain-containing protein [Xenococcus sp. (in: cyanobacteria)]
MKVRDVMTTDFVTIGESTTVDTAINIMKDNGLRSLIIEPLDKKDSYGVLTEIDILYKVVAKGHNPEDLCVRDIMTKPCIEVKPDLDIQSVAQLFAKTGICSAPIVQKKIFSPKKLLGVVSVNNLIRQSNFAQQPRDGRKSHKLDNKLTDYQRLRSQGSISAHSTRILDKMPQEQTSGYFDDLVAEPESKDDTSERIIQDPTAQKSSPQDQDRLTDYQRLRSQGAISTYSTRILDKMPTPQEPSQASSSDFIPQSEQRDDSPEETTPESESKKPQDKLTDYQRLRSQGSISRYSTRILDKMPQEPKDD